MYITVENAIASGSMRHLLSLELKNVVVLARCKSQTSDIFVELVMPHKKNIFLIEQFVPLFFEFAIFKSVTRLQSTT